MFGYNYQSHNSMPFSLDNLMTHLRLASTTTRVIDTSPPAWIFLPIICQDRLPWYPCKLIGFRTSPQRYPIVHILVSVHEELEFNDPLMASSSFA